MNPHINILIVSSHPLFAHGLQNLLETRGESFRVVGTVSSVEAAISFLDTQRPHVVIVDYDDEVVNREAFLTHFVGGLGELRVVFLSLMDGRAGQQAVVYERRTMAAAEMDSWFEGWSGATVLKRPPAGRTAGRSPRGAWI